MTKFVFIDNKKYTFEATIFNQIKNCKNMMFKDVNGEIFKNNNTILRLDRTDVDGHEYYLIEDSLLLAETLQDQIGGLLKDKPAADLTFNGGSGAGIYVRNYFDADNSGSTSDIPNINVVPATYWHNFIYSPNPLYPTGKFTLVDKTPIVVLCKFGSNIHELLPNSTYDDADTFSEYMGDDFTKGNNAFYGHDSNSTDQHTFSLQPPGTDCSFGTKGGSSTDTNGTVKSYYWDCNNFLTYSNATITSGSNPYLGKGLHNPAGQSWDPFDGAVNLAHQYVSTNENGSTTSNDSIIGRFETKQFWKGKGVYLDMSLSTLISTLSSVYFRNTGKPYNHLPNMINLAPEVTDPAGLYKGRCHDRIDFMIPWTNNIPDMILWQNALWEQRNTLPCEWMPPASPPIKADNYWQGWNEIPVKPKINEWTYSTDNDYLLNIFFPAWINNYTEINSYVVKWNDFRVNYLKNDDSTSTSPWILAMNQLDSYIQTLKGLPTTAKASSVSIIFSCEMPRNGNPFDYVKYFFTFDTLNIKTSKGRTFIKNASGMMNGAYTYRLDKTQQWLSTTNHSILFRYNQNKCVNLADNSINIWDCAFSSDTVPINEQQWYFNNSQLQSGVNDTYCIDIPGGGMYNGAKLQQWTCLDISSQRWTTNGTDYQFKSNKKDSAGREYCIDLNAGVDDNGTQLQIWQCET